MRRSIFTLCLTLAGGCSGDGGSEAAETETAASSETASATSDTTPGSSVTGATDPSGMPATEGATSTGEPPSACAASPEALSGCVDIAAYSDDLAFIADLRTPGSPHWQAVQDVCADRLTELGFTVDLFEYGTGTNVIGTRVGATPDAPHVLIGAHYDHIEGCVGADDNATGVAASLEIARVLAEGSYENTLTIACWDEEEVGLLGSEAFANAALGQGIEFLAYYNLEMVGMVSDEPNSQSIPAGFDFVFPQQIAEIEADEFRGNFLFVAADNLAAASLASMQAHAERLDFKLVGVTLSAAQKNDDLFGDLRRSDHAPFWLLDYPALFITDTGEFRNTRYHCLQGEDTIDALTPSFAEGVMQVTVGSAAEALGLL